jgi:SAM-dependent methyltransferase
MTREAGIARLSSLDIKKNSRDYLVMRFLIQDLKKAISEFASGKMLDIGCGNKPYEVLFEGLIESYTGCDMVQSHKNRVDVICPATDLRFPDESFNTVFSTQVMEHVDDPGQMIKESSRVLKDKGLAIFSIPFCWELHEEPHDYFRFTKYGLTALFEKQQFDIVRIDANGGKWAAIFQMNLNMIYSSFGKRSFVRRATKFVFINLHLTSVINRFAVWMDQKFHDELLTLNYVVVARKRSIKN